jgi:hypothetical protein
MLRQLKRAADGGLTLQVQADSPGQGGRGEPRMGGVLRAIYRLCVTNTNIRPTFRRLVNEIDRRQTLRPASRPGI